MKVGRATIHSYWLMFIATVITVSIVTSSQLITDRIGLLLDRQASELLAADMVIISSREFDADYRYQALQQGLRVSNSVSLRTAIFIDDDPRLIELKAVDDAYPLRGRLERAREVTGERSATTEIPARGKVWVDTKLAQLVGTRLALGEANLDTSWLLTFEPDRGGAIFNLAPRVLMNLEDLPLTSLVVPGSRVRYRMMFAGTQGDINRFKTWLTINLKAGEEIQDLENARPEMRQALERTRKFFALAIVLTLVIAMAATLYRQSRGAQGCHVARLRHFAAKPVSLLPAATWRTLGRRDHHRDSAWMVRPVSATVGAGWMVWQDVAAGTQSAAIFFRWAGRFVGTGRFFTALPGQRDRNAADAGIACRG
jgi:predicted lysophospholipase L1 biosynthesis ABC-type transport system permease subunit